MPRVLPAIVVGAALLLAAGTALIIKLHGHQSPTPLIVEAPSDAIRVQFKDKPAIDVTLPDGRREQVHSLLNVKRRMHFGDFEWNEQGVPSGPVWVRVDLASQTISAFRAGQEIGTAVILYGTDGHPTPTGAFTIKEKDKDHWSQSYDAPMAFMMRLTDDGVAIHASQVEQGYATHGCIGVPRSFARHLFDAVKTGDIVLIQTDASTRVS